MLPRAAVTGPLQRRENGLRFVTMNLPEYINTIGPTAAQTLFTAAPATIKAWRLGYRIPSPEAARRIIDATGGKLGWNDIYPPAPAADRSEAA